MTLKTELGQRKNIALVAHDSCKKDLLEWCRRHLDALKKHDISASGTTGQILSAELGLNIKKFISGPLGGDLQIGAGVVQGEIDLLIFFWDPLESLPHDPDVRALLRVATMWNIPMACNEASADFFITSPLIDQPYQRRLSSVEAYKKHRKSPI